MTKKKEYQNYIFDLYGTLLDVHTDETKRLFWKRMSELYAVYGCEYSAKEIQEKYLSLVKKEEDALREKTGYEYPEIELRYVFADLLAQCEQKHPCTLKVNGNDISYYDGAKGKKRKELADSDWCAGIANTFRLLSRKKCEPYADTIETLSYLLNAGKKLYILSNAQAVFTIPEMEAAGLMPYFEKVYISSDAGMKKPQKEFMELLLEKEGLCKEECVMIGNDFSSDIRIALELGMDSVFLNTFGFDKAERKRQYEAMTKNVIMEKEELKALKPRIIVSGRLSEILEVK